MDDETLRKKVAEYEQQAEMMLANYHRFKGAAIALKELLEGKLQELQAVRNSNGDNDSGDTQS